MDERQMNEHVSGDTGKRLKRRGILAAAGAAVAGIMAKQAAQRVDAAPTVMMTETANVETATTSIVANPGTYSAGGAFVVSVSQGFQAVNGMTVTAGSVALGGGIGIIANGGAAHAGLEAHGGNSPISVVPSGPGVVGLAGNVGPATGDVSSCGVYGEAVTRFANPGFTLGLGVHGKARVDNIGGFTRADGVFGESDAPQGIGVRGDSTNDTGVYGTGKNYGVRGDAGSGAGAAGLLGVSTTANAVGIGSVVVSPATIAGYFKGSVYVEGKLVVSDPSYKSGLLDHPDGSKRLVYCIESPESWIEDFGEGTLANGKATIMLDKDFAAVVHTDAYHVFPVSHDPASGGLAVAARHADRFEVREHSGGTTNGSFSYRVVAKPKSSVKAERLAKFDVPHLAMPESVPKKP